MSAQGRNRTIVAALLTNVVIAIAKFVAWALSGSFALLGEAVHSLASSGKQLLQVLGGREALPTAGDAAQPEADAFADARDTFARTRARSVYAFAGAIMLFSVGGVFSIYAGLVKLQQPEPLEMWWLPVTVLVLALVVKCVSLYSALTNSRPLPGHGGLSSLRETLSPGMPRVRLSEPASIVSLIIALVGVVATVITGNGVFDGTATLLIGALMLGIAIIIGTDIQRLLFGDGVTDSEIARIEAAITDCKEIDRLIHLSVYSLGPQAMLVGAKISLPGHTPMSEVSVIVKLAERRVRDAVPTARAVYLEPDVWLDPALPTPTTSSIVMLSSD